MKLVIVESPAKCAKIQHYLGDGYQVEASFGHIRDLGTGLEAININSSSKQFQPKYLITKSKVVAKLRKLAAVAEEVIIASDLDREGEAIGFHLANVLKLPLSSTKRIVFNQITKSAIQHALENHRTLDKNIFDAQQARRVLDRLIGYSVSPVLWKYVASKLSAGRCQSPAIGLLHDRENEIENFTSTATYSMTGLFKINNETSLQASFTHTLTEQKLVIDFIRRCQTAYFETGDSTITEHTHNPPPPFTTSSFQQACSQSGISPKAAMSISQKLYEAGLITYMRTDSIQLSKECRSACAKVISDSYPDYLKTRVWAKGKQKTQEAHEAIHPVYMDKRSLPSTWDSRSQKVYQMIWKRTIASQMKAKCSKKCRLTILMYETDVMDGSKNEMDIEYSLSEEKAQCEVDIVTFDGWTVLYGAVQNDMKLWDMVTQTANNVECICQSICAAESFSRPPTRYSQAQLIKKLEKCGIGRPSTFSSIITTITDRNYACIQNVDGELKDVSVLSWERGTSDIHRNTKEIRVGAEKNRLCLTEIGHSIVEFLQKYFPFIMDYNYTAGMEENLDKISEGTVAWKYCVKNAYTELQTCEKQLATLCNPKTTKLSQNRHLLGKHPHTHKSIYVFTGKKGTIVQHGEESDLDATYSVLHKKRKKCENLKLADVVDVIPRDFGMVDDKPVLGLFGKHGPFLKYGKNRFISLPETSVLSTLTREDCLQIIKEDADKPVKTTILRNVSTGKNPITIHDGPYGKYIRRGRTIRSLPKTLDHNTITKSECLAILKLPKAKKKKRK